MSVVIPFGDAQRLREQDQMVFGLRLRGKSERETAEALDLSTTDVRASMRRMIVELTPSFRADLVSLELDRLDAMMQTQMDAALRGDRDAIEVCLKLMDRRSKLIGLDAPVKTVAVVKAEEKTNEAAQTPADKMLRRLQEIAGAPSDPEHGPVIDGEVVPPDA